MRGAGIVAGLGVGAVAKQFVLNLAPPDQQWPTRIYGAISILAGAMLNMNARQPMLKAMGTGILAYGIADLLITNVKPLAEFLPQISGPAAFAPAAGDLAPDEVVEGGMNYGRSVMGASLVANKSVEIVGAGMGANLQAGVDPEIVGDDDDYEVDNLL